MASDGTVWVATTSNGISRFDGTGWKSFTVDDGLIDNSTSAIRVHPNGSVWIGTPEGVSRFDGVNWISYTTDDGLLNNKVEQISIAPDGTVCFATGSGISCLKLEGE